MTKAMIYCFLCVWVALLTVQFVVSQALWDLRAQVCLLGKQTGVKLTLKCTPELEQGKH